MESEKRRVVSVGENTYQEILRQGLEHEMLFKEREWETNHRGLESLKGAVLISAFHSSTHWKLFFRTPEGKILRVILPADYFGRPFEVKEL